MFGEELQDTYLTLDGSSIFVVTIGASEAGAWSGGLCSISIGNTPPLRKILFPLRLADLHLLLLTTTAQLVRLELTLGLELGAAVLWDVAFGHLGVERDWCGNR